MCPARLCPFYRFVGAPREARDPRHAVGVETVTLQSRDDLAGCILGPVRNFVSTELASRSRLLPVGINNGTQA